MSGHASPSIGARGTSRVQLFQRDGTRTRFSPGEWRESALPTEIDAAWHDHDRLSVLADLATEEDLLPSALRAAERLVELEPECPTCACRLARLLQRTDAIDRAKEVLESHLALAGDSAPVLTSLARLHTFAGEGALARRTVRRALALDPNHRPALTLWRLIYRMPVPDAPFGSLGGGDGAHRPDARDAAGTSLDGIEACLLDAAREPGSWRPQLELGRLSLERGEDALALDCFRSAIARASGEGDAAHTAAYLLADAGRIEDLVELARELGRLEHPETEVDTPARRIIEQLKQGREIVEDLLERELPLLAHHFEEIGTALEPEEEPDPDAEGQLVLEFGDHLQVPQPRTDTTDGLRTFSYQGPLWGQLLREALVLLPPKRPGATRVTCFAASDAAASLDPTERQAERERAAQVAMLPLYLTESLSLTTDARADCTLPFDDPHGLQRRVQRYTFPEMRDACRPEASAYLVGCHSYRDLGDSWLEVKLWDVARERCVAERRRPVRDSLCRAMQLIGDDLKDLLAERARVTPYDAGEIPVPLPARLDPDYLSALADLLDLALLDLGIPATLECPAIERYDRLLQVARQTSAEPIHRVMAIAAFAEDAESSASNAVPSAAVIDSLQALLDTADVAGTSLGTLLPALGPRLAAR